MIAHEYANPALLDNRSTIKDFSVIIEKAYNFHALKQIPLAFMADKVARDRGGVKLKEMEVAS